MRDIMQIGAAVNRLSRSNRRRSPRTTYQVDVETATRSCISTHLEASLPRARKLMRELFEANPDASRVAIYNDQGDTVAFLER